jgi:hypothetical protein
MAILFIFFAYSVYYPVFGLPAAFGQMMNQSYGPPCPLSKMKTSGWGRIFLTLFCCFHQLLPFKKHSRVMFFPLLTVLIPLFKELQ